MLLNFSLPSLDPPRLDPPRLETGHCLPGAASCLTWIESEVQGRISAGNAFTLWFILIFWFRIFICRVSRLDLSNLIKQKAKHLKIPKICKSYSHGVSSFPCLNFCCLDHLLPVACSVLSLKLITWVIEIWKHFQAGRGRFLSRYQRFKADITAHCSHVAYQCARSESAWAQCEG